MKMKTRKVRWSLKGTVEFEDYEVFPADYTDEQIEEELKELVLGYIHWEWEEVVGK